MAGAPEFDPRRNRLARGSRGCWMYNKVLCMLIHGWVLPMRRLFWSMRPSLPRLPPRGPRCSSSSPNSGMLLTFQLYRTHYAIRRGGMAPFLTGFPLKTSANGTNLATVACNVHVRNRALRTSLSSISVVFSMLIWTSVIVLAPFPFPIACSSFGLGGFRRRATGPGQLLPLTSSTHSTNSRSKGRLLCTTITIHC